MGGIRQNCCYWVWVLLWGLTVSERGVGERGKVSVGIPKVARPLTQELKRLPFEEAYMPLFGDSNVHPSPDGNSVKLILDKRSGSGLISHDLYHLGFFSASIKLPEGYTAGVMVMRSQNGREQIASSWNTVMCYDLQPKVKLTWRHFISRLRSLCMMR